MNNILVTGASRGIGLTVSQRLAKAGYGVTLCASNGELLNSRISKLPVVNEHQKHDVWRLDMSDLQAVSDMKECPRPLNKFSGFVNCAGVAGMGLLLSQSTSGIQKTLNINLHAPMLMAKHISRAMIKNTPRNVPIDEFPRRHLIFISSILSSKGVTGSTVYSATKAGVEGLSRSLAREVGSRGIAVNCIVPGLVETEMGLKADHKLMENNIFPGFVSKEEVADTVMFLLNSNSLTGTTITIDRGCSV